MITRDDKQREALKKILLLRSRNGRIKTTRRNIDETIRLARIAKFLFNEVFEEVKWEKEERILRLKIEKLMSY